MSESEPTVTYEPRHFVHRRTEVDAIFYDGTEHCRRAIVEWVRLGGGHAEIRPDGDLLVLGARGWLFVRPNDDHVVRSIDVPGRGREHFPMGDDVLTEAYEPGGGVDHSATLTRDQAAAIVVAADEIKDRARRALRDGENMEVREYVDSLVESVHTLATALEAER